MLPPTVLGFYVLIALGTEVCTRSMVGINYRTYAGLYIEGLVIGSVLYSLPFAVQPFAASFAAIDHRLIDASQSLGVPRLATFFRVVLPLSKPGLVSGVMLSFAHTLGEFGVVLMVGGNIPGITRTVSVDIYDQVQAGNYVSANHTSLVLLLISFLTLSVVYGINRGSHLVWPWR